MATPRIIGIPLFRASSRLQLRAAVRPASIRTYVAGTATVSETIKSDHRELEHAYDEVVNSADHDNRDRFGNQLTWELARHSIAEELIVYPAFEKYLGAKGKEMADKDRKEHHKVCLASPLESFTSSNAHIKLAQRASQRVPKLESHTSRLHTKAQVSFR